MTTKTDTATTDDELHELGLAQRKREVEDARLALGAAELDGKSTAAATKRLRAATDALQRAEAALVERGRRDAEAAELDRAIKHLEQRAAAYRWTAGYFAAAEEIVRSFEAMTASIRRLRASKPPRALGRLRANNSSQGQTIGDLEFDPDLLRFSRRWPNQLFPSNHPFGTAYTVERCRELRESATALAEADEAKVAGLREGDPA